MRRPEYPKSIKVGQTKATIYKTPSHGCDSYTVVWYEGAARKRKTFATPEAALIHANSKVSSLARGEAEIIRLSGEERLAYTRAKNALAEFNQSLDTIAHEYRDAKRVVNGISLVEVGQYYASQRLRDIPRKTVAAVFAEMMKAKRDEGLSERYLEDLDNRLGRFANDFKCNLTAVTGLQIRDWLQALPIANRTRNNFRMAIQTLFAFAKTQKYLPADWKEFDSIPVWKVKPEAIEIFSPDELNILLTAADKKLAPFLLIGAFAGLRSAEIERLDWSKVNFTSGYITVDAGIAKTNSRRLVPISPNLKVCLTPFAKPRGPVMELANVPNSIRRLIESTRPVDPKNPDKMLKPLVEWRHNALRHSYCSYRLALIKNAAEVALEAGNTPQMIFKCYRELVTEKDAKVWFSITPIVRANSTCTATRKASLVAANQPATRSVSGR